jgi:hypothetical protein
MTETPIKSVSHYGKAFISNVHCRYFQYFPETMSIPSSHPRPSSKPSRRELLDETTKGGIAAFPYTADFDVTKDTTKGDL